MMKLMRRVLMMGAAATLLAVGAVGCNDDGEVTAPGPRPTVEESDEEGEQQASDAYNSGKQDENGLSNASDGSEEAKARAVKLASKALARAKEQRAHESSEEEAASRAVGLASKPLERAKEQRSHEGSGEEAATLALDVLEKATVHHVTETVRAHHTAKVLASYVADHVQGLRNVSKV